MARHEKNRSGILYNRCKREQLGNGGCLQERQAPEKAEAGQGGHAGGSGAAADGGGQSGGQCGGAGVPEEGAGHGGPGPETGAKAGGAGERGEAKEDRGGRHFRLRHLPQRGRPLSAFGHFPQRGKRGPGEGEGAAGGGPEAGGLHDPIRAGPGEDGAETRPAEGAGEGQGRLAQRKPGEGGPGDAADAGGEREPAGLCAVLPGAAEEHQAQRADGGAGGRAAGDPGAAEGIRLGGRPGEREPLSAAAG